jgi:hypothetical protein
MMPVIRISDATWQRLQLHARPFEHTPEDIVRMALDALEGVIHASPKPAKKRTLKRTKGDKLPQREFRAPLLIALLDLGGSAEVGRVKNAMLPLIKDQLQPGDFELVSTGEERWWNAACWERNDLRKAGLIKDGSPRGYWELSEAGKRQAALL